MYLWKTEKNISSLSDYETFKIDYNRLLLKETVI